MKPENMFEESGWKGKPDVTSKQPPRGEKREVFLLSIAIIHYKLNVWIQEMMCKASQDAAHEDSLE